VSRYDQLAKSLRSAQGVDKPEQVDVVEALQRIVQHDYLQGCAPCTKIQPEKQ